MKKHNVGIIGYGWAAAAHIDAINLCPQAQVTAVWSSRPLDAAELSKTHRCPIKVYTDLAAMLADPEIHVVDIAGYPNKHAEQFIAAARAGKQIILEKPMAVEWSEILAMKKAADETGVKVCVCFECRYTSQFMVTKSTLDSGIIGDVHYGEVDYYHGCGPWYGQYRWNTKKELGGSALLTAGCHALDALLFCLGPDVEEVTSYSSQSSNPIFAKYEYHTAASTLLRFKNGAIGKTAAVVDCLQPYYFHTHLVGSLGTILDNKFYTTKYEGLNRHAWSTLAMKMLDSGDVSDHAYHTQFQAFFDALDRGEQMPRTNFYDAFQSHRVIAAADLSAKERRSVRVEEIPAS